MIKITLKITIGSCEKSDNNDMINQKLNNTKGECEKFRELMLNLRELHKLKK